jgi:hypothetical protein
MMERETTRISLSGGIGGSPRWLTSARRPSGLAFVLRQRLVGPAEHELTGRALLGSFWQVGAAGGADVLPDGRKAAETLHLRGVLREEGDVDLVAV